MKRKKARNLYRDQRMVLLCQLSNTLNVAHVVYIRTKVSQEECVGAVVKRIPSQAEVPALLRSNSVS